MSKNRKKLYIILGIVLVFVLGIAAFLVYVNKNAGRNNNAIRVWSARAFSSIENKLCSGDLIFRAGSGIWSDGAVMCSRYDKRYSHVGILFFEDGQWWVIHSESDGFFENKEGVFIQSAVSFVNEINDFAVYRLKDPAAAAKLPGCAKKYLDIPFDFGFDLEDQQQIYCTELIYLAMQDAGITLETYIQPALKRRVMPVDSCLDKKFFDEIATIENASKNFK